MDKEYFNKAPFSVVITDKNAKIIYANEKAMKVFERFGNFIGKNLADCHNEKSREKIKDMFKRKYINQYTIEKNAVKKLIYQFPYFNEKNEFNGYIEFSIELDKNIPHFIRENT